MCLDHCVFLWIGGYRYPHPPDPSNNFKNVPEYKQKISPYIFVQRQNYKKRRQAV